MAQPELRASRPDGRSRGTLAGPSWTLVAPGTVAALLVIFLVTATATAEAKLELRASGLEPGFRAEIDDYTVRLR